MTERYDRTSAAHYAAYRPPLHRKILRSALPADEVFSVGVDVGCGTGQSAVALAEYCAKVYAVDPSVPMLTAADGHERVVYLAGTAERIPLRERSVDVATFGGSLHYADADAASERIQSICRPGAIVLVYDFDVLLAPVLKRLGMSSQPDASDYDHLAGFSGRCAFTELGAGSQRVPVSLSAHELAHLLLSDSNRADRFATKLGTADAFPALVAALRTAWDDVTVEADVYHSKYRVSKTE